RIDPVVRRRVELVDVERRALAARGARGARSVGLTVDWRLAVQCLGQDARGRGLARSPRPAEEVRVGHAAVADLVSQGPGDVVLAPNLAESLGAIAPIERL